MPAPLDLTGRRFGKLLVLRADGKVKFGRMMTAWLCRCDCGAEERVPQNRLPHSPYIADHNPRHIVTACTTCRHTRVCEVCGKTFISEQARATCSDECFIAHRRAKDLRHYYKQAAADPDYNRGRWRAAVERMRADPEKLSAFYDRANEAKRRSIERSNADPEKRQTRLERQRRWYAEQSEKIQAARQARLAARLAAMTPEERQARAAHLRELSRKWWAMRREQIRADSKRHSTFLDNMREYRRRHEARKALADLITTAAELETRSKK